MSKCATKVVENSRKRKQMEVTELQFTTASHQVRVQQEADGEVTYVGVSKLHRATSRHRRLCGCAVFSCLSASIHHIIYLLS
eukprot:COSAG01_NODE_25109_length_755_cov_1.109756_2_plen_82_part_00